MSKPKQVFLWIPKKVWTMRGHVLGASIVQEWQWLTHVNEFEGEYFTQWVNFMLAAKVQASASKRALEWLKG